MAMAMASSLNPKSLLNPNPPPLLRNGAQGVNSLPWRSRFRRRGTAPSRTIISSPRLPLGNLSSLFRLRCSKEADEYDVEYDEREPISTSSSVMEASIAECSRQDGYIGLFIGMLALDKDLLEREQAVDWLWKYSRGGKQSIDNIMQFPGCVNLMVSLLRLDSCSTCEATAGLLREISSVNMYREIISDSGAIEEIAALLRRLSLTAEVKVQSIGALWNLSVEEGPREKIVKSDLLPVLLKCLDDDDREIKEASCGVLSNLALSQHYHSIMVEAGIIPKLAELFKCQSKEYDIIREEAKTALLEFCKDEYNKILVIEEGLLPVPLVGSEAYKSYKTVSHTRPSFLHGAKKKKQSKPSRFGADEVLAGLQDHGFDNLDEYKEKAIIAHSLQHFLAGIGAIELEGEEPQLQSSRNKQQVLLPLEDGVARLVLIMELEDTSAISRAARAVADSSISEHIRISFKEAGAIKPLVHHLHHNDEAVRDSAAHALEMLCISSGVCNAIESENLFHSLFGLVTNPTTPVNIKEKVVNILARVFNPEKLLKAELNDKVRASENPPKSVKGSPLRGLGKATDPISVPKTESGETLLNLGIVFHLVDLLKTCSLNMQRKLLRILEYLANFDVHLSEVISSDIDAALVVVFDQGCFNGENDNELELHTIEVEEAGLVVESASRLLTKLLDFDQFYSKKDLIPLLNLLRKILKSKIPLRAKDWIAACLVKMQLLLGPDTRAEHSINMEVTLYETIPRLIEQMRASSSLEYREAAVINLKDVVSEGMIECSREIASLGGIFPLVEILGQVDGPCLDAGLALLYNLSMDIENHHAIISAGAIPVLRRIVLSQKPQWPLALNLLRTLPT